MPMCESVLALQQGPRLASSPQAVQLALRPLALGRLLAICLLSALIPWPCVGLRGNTILNNGVNNGTTDFLTRESQWKHSTPTVDDESNRTRLIISAEKSIREIDLKLGGQDTQPPYPSGKRVRSYPVDANEELIYSRQPRSSRRRFWAAEIEHKERRQTLAESHILVPDAEQMRYMYRRKQRVFSFSIKETTWLEVVLTPCSSNVTWSFLSPESGYIRQQRGEKKVLFSYTGAARQSFKAKLTPNHYSINVTSLNGDYDSLIYIYRNTATDVAAGGGLLYPPLPPDAQVRAKAEGSSRSTRKLDVWWKPAAVSSHGLHLEYCLAISSIKNFRTHCAALAYAKGVKRPKQPRWGSRKDYQRTNQARGAFDRPMPAYPPKSIYYTCIGNKTSFTFTDGMTALRLRGGKKFYIDVFVKYVDKNTFSAYKGVSAKMKKKKLHSLKVGDSRTFTLRPRKRPVVEIMLNATFPKLILEVISCQGKIPVRIYRNDKRVREKRISRYKQIVIPNEPQGAKFLVKFPLSDRRRQPPRVSSRQSSRTSIMKKRRRQKKKQGVAYVTLSLPLQRSPIKALPKNMTVSVIPYLSGCRNVTLEWRAAGTDYKYCVYYRPVGKTPEHSRETKDICRAAGEEPRHTSLAGCIEHPVKHPDRDTLTYNVQGLETGTCYRFDILVNRDGMASVPYGGVRLRTPKKCRKAKPRKHNDFSCLRRNRKKGPPGKGRRRNG